MSAPQSAWEGRLLVPFGEPLPGFEAARSEAVARVLDAPRPRLPGHLPQDGWYHLAAHLKAPPRARCAPPRGLIPGLTVPANPLGTRGGVWMETASRPEGLWDLVVRLPTLTPALVAWEVLLAVLSAERALPPPRVGWCLGSVDALVTEASDCEVVCIAPDAAAMRVELYERPELAVLALHQLACHEYAHVLRGHGPTEHDEAFNLLREELAEQSWQWLPWLQEALGPLLTGVRRATADERRLTQVLVGMRPPGVPPSELTRFADRHRADLLDRMRIDGVQAGAERDDDP